jgi:hypothetical protein
MSKKSKLKLAVKGEPSLSGVPQTGAKGTVIEEVTTPRQLFMFFFKLDHPSSIDCLGGEGFYAVVRKCRHAHKKGKHFNWYRHIVFQQFDTLEEARKDVKEKCVDLKDRLTEMGADCDEDKHSLLQAISQPGGWRCRHLPKE